MFGSNTLSAQETACGTEDPTTSSGFLLNPDEDCFDVDIIYNTCTDVHVRVNVHFFLNDDCSGGIQYPSAASPFSSNYIPPKKGYETAQEIIDDANEFLIEIQGNGQWNQAHWGADVTDPTCVPIRYLLSGVYFHCNTADKTGGSLSATHSTYGVNPDAEINLYIKNCTALNCTGVATYNETGVIVEGIGWFTGGTLVHEIGHTLSLRHTWLSSQNCNDVPQPEEIWDKNCDGTDTEIVNQCWDDNPTSDDVSLCTDDCSEHPCCSWSMQSNNVMTYSGWSSNYNYAAFTPCQVNRMLSSLASEDKDCGLIEEISTDCPPPRAFVDIQPVVIPNSPGEFVIWLEGSDNEKWYKLEFHDEYGNLINATGWVQNQAKKYVITTCRFKQTSTTWPGGFEPETNYTVTLYVENNCGDAAEMSLDFTTPVENCITPVPNEGPRLKIAVSPNPTYENLEISYELEELSTISIYSYNLNSGVTHTLKQIETKPSGEYIEMKNVGDHTEGPYMIFYDLNGDLYPATTFIKM